MEKMTETTCEVAVYACRIGEGIARTLFDQSQ